MIYWRLERKEWNLIKSGEKKYHFEKLSEGTISCTVEVEDMNDNKLGKIELKPVEINCDLRRTANAEMLIEHWFIDRYGNQKFIDVDTYEFVKKNYIDKKIDFVAYEIKVVE